MSLRSKNSVVVALAVSAVACAPSQINIVFEEPTGSGVSEVKLSSDGDHYVLHESGVRFTVTKKMVPATQCTIAAYKAAGMTLTSATWLVLDILSFSTVLMVPPDNTRRPEVRPTTVCWLDLDMKANAVRVDCRAMNGPIDDPSLAAVTANQIRAKILNCLGGENRGHHWNVSSLPFDHL